MAIIVLYRVSLLQWLYLWLLTFTLIIQRTAPLQVYVTPKHYLCPDSGYTCQGNGVTTLGWITNTTASDALTFSDISNEGSEKRAGGFTAKLLTKITAIESTLNMTSIIYVNNYAELNGTTLTCRGIKGVTTNQDNDTISVCIVGNASKPTDLSVDCGVDSVAVSFQPPVYGAECVVNYTVLAVRSNEESMMCSLNSTTNSSYTYNCPIPDSETGYYYTVTPVAYGLDGVKIYGETAICDTPSPENITILEHRCGYDHQFTLVWNAMEAGVEMVRVSWRATCPEDGDTMCSDYSDIDNKGFHQISFKCCLTGAIEFTVSYVNDECTKQTSVVFEVERVIRNVSFDPSTEVLTVLSRDCFNSNGSYSVVLYVYTQSSPETMQFKTNFKLKVTFNVSSLLEIKRYSTYSYSVNIVLDSYDVIIDEWNGTFSPNKIIPEVEGSSKEEEGDETLYTAVGAGGGGGVAVLLIILLVLMVVAVARNRQRKRTNRFSEEVKVGEHNTLSLRAQVSIEERRYDPLAGPPTAPPPKPPPPAAAAAAAAADTLSDPLPDPLYEAVNTLKKGKHLGEDQRKDQDKDQGKDQGEDQRKDQEEAHMYHVLEEPKSPEQEQPSAVGLGELQTDASQKCSEVPMYSVVDISKKKNRKNGSTPAAAGATSPVHSSSPPPSQEHQL